VTKSGHKYGFILEQTTDYEHFTDVEPCIETFVQYLRWIYIGQKCQPAHNASLHHQEKTMTKRRRQKDEDKEKKARI
jgi:hypothetical protein